MAGTGALGEAGAAAGVGVGEGHAATLGAQALNGGDSFGGGAVEHQHAVCRYEG